ncbi:MAG: hypothetical protein AABZ60_16610 [Planctomycetota bacterium]
MNVLLPLEVQHTKYLSRKQDSQVQAFLALARESIDPLDLRIRIRILDQIFSTCLAWTELQNPEALWDQCLQTEMKKCRQELGRLQQENQEFLKTIQATSIQEKRDTLLLNYLNALAKTAPTTVSHCTKLQPFMDLDAVQEIFFSLRLGYCIRLELILLLACVCLKKAVTEKQNQIKTIALEEFQKNPRWQTQLVCLKAIGRLPPCFPAQEDPCFLFLPQYCMQPQEQIWLWTQAFDLWFTLDPEKATLEAQNQLAQHSQPQHFFLRQQLVKLLERQQCWDPLLKCLHSLDPSEMVMLQILTSLAHRFSEKLAIVFSDPRYSLKLKAHALIQIVTFAPADFSAQCLLENLKKPLHETPFFRIILEETHHWLKQNFPHHSRSQELLNSLQNLRTESLNPKVQNLAFELSERILQYQLPYHLMLEEKLFSLLDQISPGKKLKIRKTEIPLASDLLGRHLTRYCARSFPVQIQETSKFWIVFRGDCVYRSLWRFFHEIRNPSPEKRRTSSHLVGHLSLGTLRIPSPILSELSKTKVPGEHTYAELYGGWSPHIPTIEDFLSVLRLSLKEKRVSIFTFRGITRLQGPKRRSFGSFLKMSWNFEELDQFRKRACENEQEMKAFQEHLLQQYGIHFFLEPYSSSYEFQNG